MKAWELLRDTFLDMGMLKTAIETTGGSTTLWTDTSLALSADTQINGSLIVLSAGGTAPEGEVVKITDNATTTLTTSAVTTANAAGDVFGWVSKEFKTEMLLTFINMALRKVGLIGIQDTSITTASNQTEYTLPTAIKKGRIRGIYYQTETNDANDNRWFPLRSWQIQPATAGNTAVLVLPQFASGHKVLIEYIGEHPAITAYSGEIHESIAPELAKASLKLVLANNRAEGAISSQDGFNLQFNKASEEFDYAMRMWPVWKPDKMNRRLRVYLPRYVRYIESEPNRVIL